MKKFIIVLSALAAVNAFATSVPNLKMAEIVRMKTDPKEFGRTEFDSGRITLNLSVRTATLMLVQEFNCPTGQMCPMAMPAPMIYTLPIVSQTTDDCRIVTTVAKRDNRPVDGALQVLTIKDYSRDVCGINSGITGQRRRAAPVSAVFTTQTESRGGAPLSTRSLFLATEFANVHVQH